MVVMADVFSSDMKCFARFNIEPALAQADNLELSSLIAADWGMCNVATSIAKICRTSNEIAKIFDYVSLNKLTGNKVTVECLIDIDQANAWLSATNPSLASEISFLTGSAQYNSLLQEDDDSAF